MVEPIGSLSNGSRERRRETSQSGHARLGRSLRQG